MGWMLWTVLVLLTLALVYWLNNSVPVLSRYTIACPAAKEPVTVVQLSDLHSKRFYGQERRLVQLVKACAPDLIVLTGDLIDPMWGPMENVTRLVAQLTPVAPVVAIPGNHETREGSVEALERALGALEVQMLRGEHCTLWLKGTQVSIVGFENSQREAARELAWLQAQSGVHLVLDHFPENFDRGNHGPGDVVFSGHAHGGQIRLPLLGGLYAPGQGLLPRYSAGVHPGEGGASLVVSRGLGSSIFPFRLFNPPELVCVTLVPEEGGANK